MKKLFAVLTFLSTVSLMGQTRNLTPTPARTIVIEDAAAVPVIRAALLQSTLIALPEQEKIATVFGGDTVNWIIDGGHVASRFLSVKPRSANVTTNVHIVSDHGNEYTFELREISAEADAHFDSKVILEPGTQSAKDKLTSEPVFVPAAELDRVKKEADKARTDDEATRKAEQSKNEQYRAEYPSSLKFDYSWDAKKGSQLGLKQIWHDDKFTYLRGQFQETPALYEDKDKKGSLINWDYSNGLYTVPKLMDRGYLAIGKKKVEFYRERAR